MLTTKMTWAGGLKFEGVSVFGHKIATDVARDAGGNEDGYKPTELLLFGIAGCTGVDIVRILKKQRQQVTGIDIDVTGHQPDEYPKPFETVEIAYAIRGRELDEKKVAQAIELSQAKYCVVSQTVKNPGRVVTSFRVVPE